MSKEKLQYLKNNIQISDGTIEWLNQLGNQVHRKMLVWLGTEYDRQDKNKLPEIQYTLDTVKYIQDWFLQTSPNISEYSFESAYEASKKWHDELAKKVEESKKKSYATNNVVFEMDEFYIVQMTTKKDLKVEGDKMGHCVGGYSVDDRHKFYSLRDKKNEPHATMEVTVNDSGQHSVVQIKGKQNRVPNVEYQYIIVCFLYEMVEKYNWEILDCSDYNNFGEERIIELVSETSCELRKTFTYKGEKKIVHMMTISQNVLS